MIGYTTKGEKFLFDKKFYPLISQCTWSVGNHGYLQGQLDDKICLMHRVITNCPANKQVDHINHDKLDNRLSNLRICTASHNQMNAKLSQNNTSGVTGVSYQKHRDTWFAYIWLNKKRICLGNYKDINDAISARKAAETKYYGEFSYDSSQKV